MAGALRELLAGEGLFVRARLPWVEIKGAQGLDMNLDDLQALHDLRTVGFHGLYRQAQTACDLPGRFAAHDQAQDLQLTRGQATGRAHGNIQQDNVRRQAQDLLKELSAVIGFADHARIREWSSTSKRLQVIGSRSPGAFLVAGWPWEKCVDPGALARLAGDGETALQCCHPFLHASHAAQAALRGGLRWYETAAVILDRQGQTCRGALQADHQVRAQARLQPQAGQLARVEDCGNIAHVAQGQVQRAAQGGALLLQFGRYPALQPVNLELGCGQELANVVVQFAAQSLALAFLNLEHACGQLGGAQADRARPVAQVPTYADHRQ
ncbi:hypothetical protein WR25_01821 [Diploscapter pachys]|uniref:Uncharacterized protein n=1 Tax=Diploscapter pachys TaxID=2018661 RepID=A0A2A2K870_9BILA|nr:hypothetical protein WR25_01821 [Diploscapter pachys]